MATQTTSATFQIDNTGSVVSFKFLENIKQGFKRKNSSKKYKSKRTRQTKNNNLDYLIDLIFSNINRLFVLSFKNFNDDPTRNSFDKYYTSLVEI